jgi:hypothetical protein
MIIRRYLPDHTSEHPSYEVRLAAPLSGVLAGPVFTSIIPSYYAALSLPPTKQDWKVDELVTQRLL